jgi:hypothetical protein
LFEGWHGEIAEVGLARGDTLIEDGALFFVRTTD